MEIDRDLPRPAAPTTHSDAMDTSLDDQQPNDQSKTAGDGPKHALPAKPPVVQEPSPASDNPPVVNVIAEGAPGQMGKV